MSDETEPGAEAVSNDERSGDSVDTTVGPMSEPFKSTHRVAVGSMFTVGIACLAGGLLSVSSYIQIGFMDRVHEARRFCEIEWLRDSSLDEYAEFRRRITDEQERTNACRQTMAVLFQFACFLVSGVVFLAWFYRAYRNLPSLGVAATKHSPVGAIGWWFVPIGSLIVPFYIALEIWQCSHPKNLIATTRAECASTFIVRIWWAFVIVMLIAAPLMGAALPNVLQPEETIGQSWGTIVAMCASWPAGLLTVLFIFRVDANQRSRHDLYGQSMAATDTAADQ